MKKILFTFLSALALFSSCSSDNDPILGDNVSSGNDNEPKFTVNFDIKSDAFEVDKTPLRSSIENSRFLQMVIYKESGEVYSDSVYQPEALSSMVNAEGNVGLSIELPAGNYHLAFLSVTQINAIITETFQLHPQNYYTDYYDNGNASMSSSSNRYVYYETIDLEVPNTNERNAIPIELNPMWSEIELNLEDISAATIPQNVLSIRFSYTPHYEGFSVQTKLATQLAFRYNINYNPDGIGGNPMANTLLMYYSYDKVTLKYFVTKGIDNSMGFDFEYQTLSNEVGDPILIGVREVRLPNKLENGNKYIITGKLGDFNDSSSGQSMNITLGELNKEDVVIEF